MKGILNRYWNDDRAAVAPTVGLALVGLIAAGGLAFDYSRMVALDTELQQAADQAALAAAGQLDQQTNSRARATAAAQDLVQNLTYFANDGNASGTTITVPTVEFYSTYNPNRASLETSPGTLIASSDTTGDANAAYVRVTVATRTAEYALTPIVALISSPNLRARALAGVGSAICNVPPVMICNPQEPADNTDAYLPFNVAPGTGIRLIAGNADTPGNFGFLETGFGTGADDLARALGYNSPPGECLPIDGVTTKTGLNASVMSAINTRFDVTDPGLSCPNSAPGVPGVCSPSTNVRKDLVKPSGGCNWAISPNPYRPNTNAPLDSSTGYPDMMGHPRDICHAVSLDGVCSGGRIGDGTWDRDAYFRVNYNWTSASAWQAATGLPANATRYQVYQWEMANPSVSVSGTNRGIGVTQSVSASAAGYGQPQSSCRAPGIAPSATQPDRRRISAAVINCTYLDLRGKETGVEVAHWLDLFLVEPSIRRGSGSNQRTRAAEVYVEAIEVTPLGSANVNGPVRKDVPRLLE